MLTRVFNLSAQLLAVIDKTCQNQLYNAKVINFPPVNMSLLHCTTWAAKRFPLSCDVYAHNDCNLDLTPLIISSAVEWNPILFYLFSKFLGLMWNFLSLKIVINECLLHVHVMISLRDLFANTETSLKCLCMSYFSNVISLYICRLYIQCLCLLI